MYWGGVVTFSQRTLVLYLSQNFGSCHGLGPEWGGTAPMDLDLFVALVLPPSEENGITVPLLFKALIKEGCDTDVALSLSYKSEQECEEFVRTRSLPQALAPVMWRLVQAAVTQRESSVNKTVIRVLEHGLGDIVSCLGNESGRNRTGRAMRQSKGVKRLLANCQRAVEGLTRTNKVPKGTDTRLAQRSRLTIRVALECWELFRQVGDCSPRFKELYGEDGATAPGQAELDLMEATFFCSGMRTLDPATVSKYRKDCKTFAVFCRSIRKHLDTVSAFQVAAFLRDSRTCGNTVPGKRWAALKWWEGVLDLSLHCSSVTVKAQAIVVDGYGLKQLPTQAKCPDEEWVRKMEMVAAEKNGSVVFRIFAGALIAMTLVFYGGLIYNGQLT